MADPKADLKEALERELRYEISRGRSRLLLWTPGAEEGVDDSGEAPHVSKASEVRPLRIVLRGSGANDVPAWLDGEAAVQFEKTRDAALRCENCALSRTRSHVVFGTGTGRSGVMFIGEAPGRDEDLTGEPFVGRAGQLLTKVLAALEWSREDVYIANVLKCRPPENRDPMPDEVAACSPFLLRQIGLLQPKILCALGNYAAQLLLNSRSSMARLRGRMLDFQGVPMLATYHPAAVLRNPNLKKPLWEDMQLLKKTYESLIRGA